MKKAWRLEVGIIIQVLKVLFNSNLGYMTADSMERHGPGITFFYDNSKYEGEYDHDEQSGEGKFWSRQGDYYEGYFLKGKKHGKGLRVQINGFIYDGEY